ncbi:AraC family transcriptional regulator [uncultured Arcticibacterium sp.]|uniref:AraC family transcriptional regulator n=1 Tax=uncultured Arcticibacterium sp. TaxID=2173042 RepID=UPI0030F95D3F
MNELVLLNTAKVSLDEKWNYRNVVSPFYRLYYISEGEAKVTFDNKVRALRTGFMYLIPSFTLSNYSCDAFFVQQYVHIEEVLKSEASLKQRNTLLFEVKVSPLEVALFERLLAINPDMALVNSNPKVGLDLTLSRPISQSLESRLMETNGIILQLMSRFIVTENRVERTELSGINKMSEVLLFIHENYDKDLSVKKLAAIVSHNEDYFSRLFLKYIGARPLVYINRIRIEKAQHLLLFSDLTVNEIAYQVGFENRTYFSTVFKKLSGKSATEYRLASNLV